jgi:hypothetical protein
MAATFSGVFRVMAPWPSSNLPPKEETVVQMAREVPSPPKSVEPKKVMA